MKIFSLITLALLASFTIARVHQDEIKNQPIAVELPFDTPPNICFDSIYLISSYDSLGVMYIINLTGTVTEWKGGKQTQYPADVFMMNWCTWTADLGEGQYVTIDAYRGETFTYIDGQYRPFTPKNRMP